MGSLGEKSASNEKLSSEMALQSPHESWKNIEVINHFLAKRPFLKTFLTLGALLSFSKFIVRYKIPPRDFIVRLPSFQRLLTCEMRRYAEYCDYVFQTQSLFDASIYKVPYFIYTDHTWLANKRYNPPRKSWPAPNGWHSMERSLYAKASVCFTTSHFAAQSIIEDYGVPPERVEVVDSGCNIAIPSTIKTFCSPLRKVLFLGVEWERKGGNLLLEAMQIVRREIPDAQLEVVGCDGPNNIPGVRFRGRVPRSEVASYIIANDIMCLPSFAEPSAVALVEASAYGLPVVSTRVGGTPERVIDGETGLLVEPGNVTDLAEALLALMRDPQMARRFGISGRNQVLKRFTWSAVASKITHRIKKELDARPV